MHWLCRERERGCLLPSREETAICLVIQSILCPGWWSVSLSLWKQGESVSISSLFLFLSFFMRTPAFCTRLSPHTFHFFLPACRHFPPTHLPLPLQPQPSSRTFPAFLRLPSLFFLQSFLILAPEPGSRPSPPSLLLPSIHPSDLNDWDRKEDWPPPASCLHAYLLLREGTPPALLLPPLPALPTEQEATHIPAVGYSSSFFFFFFEEEEDTWKRLCFCLCFPCPSPYPSPACHDCYLPLPLLPATFWEGEDSAYATISPCLEKRPLPATHAHAMPALPC